MKNLIYNIKTLFLIISLTNFSCESDNSIESTYQKLGQSLNYQEILNFNKDKAKYNPGEEINFSVNAVHSNTTIKYKHLGKTIAEEPLSSLTWTWTPPAEDFKGYMVELVKNTDEEETVLGTVGIDVSSDWTKFPRYGFLSKFGNNSESERKLILNNLKNFHINGLQYYDWHYKHHIPLPLKNTGSPEDSWIDLFNRQISLETVEGYINTGHELNIASMFYNLIFGAWKPEEGDGFSNEWLVYNDQFHNSINGHDLGDLGKILVTNPKNQEWQNYIFDKTTDVYNHLNFDGWHLDQLGNRGTIYDYNGYQVQLENGYHDFLIELKSKFQDKKLALNAVAQFGQKNILNTPVDFAYTEVWNRVQYSDLAQVILENNEMSNNELNTVLAAYMNYNSSEGSFNTPGVLLADAVIFAFGGSHLELGEHMLSREYFPFSNLHMEDKLKTSLKEYYDFMVAYENLLRDGGTFSIPIITSLEKGLDLNNWPPVYGTISAIGKQFDNKQVIQLLNFDGVSTLEWRDNNKSQTAPFASNDFDISIDSKNPVSKVWFASPDYNGGASQELEFEYSENQLKITVPYLEYWSMLVIEN